MAGTSVTERPASRRAQMAVLFVTRIVLTTAYRIVYPFLPAIARGLGISVTTASQLVTLRLVPGLAAPWIGTLGDRQGRRRMMELALLLFVLAGLLMAAAGATWAVAGALVVSGLSKVLFDPSLQAFVADTTPYSKRARLVGLLEMSWSAAWLLGVPLSGYLIQHWGWRSPWAVLGVAGAGCLLLTHRVLPGRRLARSEQKQEEGDGPKSPHWTALLRRPAVLPLLVVGALMTFAIELPFIVYGAWLEQEFSLSLSGLGAASMAIGAAEGTAELGSSLLTDRIGKRRSILAGLLGLAGALALLPHLAGFGVVAAMGGLVLMIAAFEFSIVSLIPLASEVVPGARASFLSLNLTAALLGRMVGSLTGGWLWGRQIGSISLHSYLGAALSLTAFIVMLLGGKETISLPNP